MSLVRVHSRVSKISVLCQRVANLFEERRINEDDRKEVVFAVQVCIGHSEGKHISSDKKYAFIYARTSLDALYIAANVCYQSKLRHPIVTEVMRRILKMHGSFEVLFFNVFIFKRHIYWWENYLSEERSIHGWNENPIKSPISYVNHKESLDLIEYFLSHASMERLLFDARPPTKLWFQCSGPKRRCVDLPMEIGLPTQLPAIGTAMKLGNYEVVLILLRHGAQLRFDEQTDDLFNLADYMITCLFRSYLRGRSCFLSRIPRFDFKSLCYVMRAVLSINTEKWAKNERLNGLTGIDSDDIKTFTDHLTTNVIPVSRSGSEPTELKHMSRLTIRRILNSNWSLPHGIYSLGLPHCLEEYLDLRRD